MTGIAPSQRPIPENLKLPTELPEGAAKEKYQGQIKGEKVAEGFDKQNSMSVAEGVDPITHMASTIESRKPMLERPPLETPISSEQLKSNSQAVHRQMYTVYLTNAMHNTDTNQETYQIAVANANILLETDSNPEMRAIINEHMDEIRKVLDEGRKDKASPEAALTKGKLEEILQRMTDKLSENQSVKMQNDIKAQAEAKAKIHEKIMEKLEERNSLIQQQKKNGCSAKNIVLERMFGEIFGGDKSKKKISKKIKKLDKDINTLRAALNNQPGLSRTLSFSGKERPEGVNEKTLDKIELLLTSRGVDLQVFSPKTEDTMNALSSEETLVEGITISQESMSQAEFMRMLQQLQEINENNEKLEEAIAALQSGDPRAAAEILKGMEGGIEGLSDENSQTLNTMIDTLLNDEPLNAKEIQQREADIALEHFQEVAQEADEQQKLLGEMSDLKTVVRG